MGQKHLILEDLKLPDYQGRHVFTAHLRVVIFILFWLLTLTYFGALWKTYPYIPIIISISFILTASCYYNIINKKMLLLSVIVEMFTDILCITIVVYMTGGASSDYFLIYIIYILTAGSLYGLRIAVYTAIGSFVFYSLLLVITDLKWIPEFIYPEGQTLWIFNDPRYTYFNYIQLILFLPVVIYAVKISHLFVSMKEKALADKNKQLLALHMMSTAIQKASTTAEVVPSVLEGMIKGLGFDTCAVAIQNTTTNRLELHVPKEDAYILAIEAAIGTSIQDMQIDGLVSSSVIKKILKHRVIFKNRWTEFFKGVSPHMNEVDLDQLQDQLGFKKFVIAPLIAERRVIGGVIGFSVQEVFDTNKTDVLRNFIDQAALAIESVILIQELRDKNLQLIQANKVKTEFLAIMSHELRTPLAAVLGFTDLILERTMGELNNDQDKALQEVRKNADQLLLLINNILDLAKVESGKLELNVELFSLEDLLEDISNLFSPLLSKKDLNFTVECVRPFPCIYGDSQKLRQILINLISNAIKFTDEGGNIKVVAELIEGKELIMQVVDSGIGIREEDLDKIFELFQQADTSFTRKYQGTGIGLALTKQLTELHGGNITVESQLNQGTCFKLVIPQTNSY